MNTIDIPFNRSPFKISNIGASKILEKIILEGKFDKVHCQTPIGGALTRFVKMKNKGLKSEIIYTAHGFHFYKGAPVKNWVIFYSIEICYLDILISCNNK